MIARAIPTPSVASLVRRLGMEAVFLVGARRTGMPKCAAANTPGPIDGFDERPETPQHELACDHLTRDISECVRCGQQCRVRCDLDRLSALSRSHGVVSM